MYYRGRGGVAERGTGAKYEKVLGPLDAIIGAKLAKYHTGASPGRGKQERTTEKTEDNDREKFAVNKELLYDGQGKLNTIVTQVSTKNHMEFGNAGKNEGLQAPNIRDGAKVTGEERKSLRCKNKQRRQEQKLQECDERLWSAHGSMMDTPGHPITNKLSEYRNSMCPSGWALHHPAEPMGNLWMPNTHRTTVD